MNESSDPRSRWLAGLCPCCGTDLTEHVDGTQPEAIGEGVTICGRCVANDHMRDGFRELLLAALVASPDPERMGA
jgi:hypothetical protein